MSEERLELTVDELKNRLDHGDEPCILDVRERNEYEICRLENSILIPLSELASRFHELNTDREIVVYCRSGARSARAVQFLQSKGYTKAKNLTGGILAWANRIDPTMPTY